CFTTNQLFINMLAKKMLNSKYEFIQLLEFNIQNKKSYKDFFIADAESRCFCMTGSVFEAKDLYDSSLSIADASLNSSATFLWPFSIISIYALSKSAPLFFSSISMCFLSSSFIVAGTGILFDTAMAFNSLLAAVWSATI